MAARTLVAPNNGFSRQARSKRARRSTNCARPASRGVPKSSHRCLSVRVTNFNWNSTACGFCSSSNNRSSTGINCATARYRER
ncbi:hypothetical protein D3C81_2216730 [compost metagenome]